jgi:arylsulfatase A-like enzyme
MADEAIQYMKGLKEVAPEKPFFVYYVPGGTHAPHHPSPEWIKKISDMHLFDEGWNKLRETIFANQKRLGIMPAHAQLTPWPDGQAEFGGAKLPQWDSLSWDEKKLFIKQAEVFGAYLAYTDNEIGRVIQAVEDMGQLDNTLIIYISGDNGAERRRACLTARRTSSPPSMALPCRSRTSSSGTSSGAPTKPSRTSLLPGRGRWTRRSSG